MIKTMYKRQVLVSPVGVGCKLVQFVVYCVIVCHGCPYGFYFLSISLANIQIKSS